MGDVLEEQCPDACLDRPADGEQPRVQHEGVRQLERQALSPVGTPPMTARIGCSSRRSVKQGDLYA